MFLKHLVAVPLIILIGFAVGWLGRPIIESGFSAEETNKEAKTYQAFDFSFEYPIAYTASEKGLWSNDRYSASLETPSGSTGLSGLPDIELINASFNGSAQEFLENEFSTDVSKWPGQQEGFEFEQIQVGEEIIWKMRMAEHFDVSVYVKQNNLRFVGFKTYFSDEDGSKEAEILEMFESLKFE